MKDILVHFLIFMDSLFNWVYPPRGLKRDIAEMRRDLLELEKAKWEFATFINDTNKRLDYRFANIDSRFPRIVRRLEALESPAPSNLAPLIGLKFDAGFINLETRIKTIEAIHACWGNTYESIEDKILAQDQLLALMEMKINNMDSRLTNAIKELQKEGSETTDENEN